MTAAVTERQAIGRLDFAAREAVLFPGKADNLYRVTTGLVRLFTVDDDGSGVTLRYIKPGGYFGEEVLADRPRRYFAEAVTDTQLEVVPADQLNQDEQNALSRQLAEALDRMGSSLHRLAGKPLRARVAAEILELSDSDLAQRGSDGATVIRVTHDDLATAVGSVRETVTKVIGELVRLGGIRAGYGKVTIRDARVLRDVAGE